jgi:peroxiredoxin
MIAVNTQDDPSNAAAYAKSDGLNFVIPVDPRGGVATLYNVRGMPTTFFIDENGVIKSIKIGPFINVDEIEDRMASLK